MTAIFYIIYFASIVGMSLLLSCHGYTVDRWQWWVGMTCLYGGCIAGIGITKCGGYLS